MTPSSLNTKFFIKAVELDTVLDRARTEQWPSLHFFNHRFNTDRIESGVFFLDEVDVDLLSQRLQALTHVTSLGLVGLSVSESGAKALTALTGLTSLDLGHNNIGESGAEALAALTGLTSLHLGNNQIGESGVEALAALTGLTSLNLNSNNIGESDVEALAA
ncbi:MAG: hypothetical protein HOM25_19310, partial [Rhodospirillaceae bacterium]|nr:hypothetical protein [Rhodospirillaceae bacterium]